MQDDYRLKFITVLNKINDIALRMSKNMELKIYTNESESAILKEMIVDTMKSLHEIEIIAEQIQDRKDLIYFGKVIGRVEALESVIFRGLNNADRE